MLVSYPSLLIRPTARNTLLKTNQAINALIIVDLLLYVLCGRRRLNSSQTTRRKASISLLDALHCKTDKKVNWNSKENPETTTVLRLPVAGGWLVSSQQWIRARTSSRHERVCRSGRMGTVGWASCKPQGIGDTFLYARQFAQLRGLLR